MRAYVTVVISTMLLVFVGATACELRGDALGHIGTVAILICWGIAICSLYTAEVEVPKRKRSRL